MPVLLDDPLGGLDGSGKVGGEDGVKGDVGESPAGGGGLLAPALVQIPVALALDDLVGVCLRLSTEIIRHLCFTKRGLMLKNNLLPDEVPLHIHHRL